GAVEPNLGHLATQPTMIALSACPPHRRPSIGPTRKRAYARREASSAKTAVNEALTLYLIRATHQTLRPLIHRLHFCNSVLYFKGFSPPAKPFCDRPGRTAALHLIPTGPAPDDLLANASPAGRAHGPDWGSHG